MKTALFTNFTDESFTGYWNGKGRTFQPGESKYMPDYLARHFAKHLTNRELLSVVNGSPKYKDGEKMTSPKFPEQVPIFMELFNKAYAPDTTGIDDDLGEEKDPIDVVIKAANKNRGNQDPTEPQVIIPPDFEEEEVGENTFNSDNK